MKRQGYLIDSIATLDNIALAVWKAKKGKESREEVITYLTAYDKNAEELRQQLLFGDVHLGELRYMTIFDPKKRIISISPFADRVMQHALMNVCHDNFENYQVSNSFASRKGKGVYAAIEQAQVYQRKYKWYLKMDMQKYFDNIEHNVLKEMLVRRFKDKRLLNVFDTIINHYSVTHSRGLPIGNLTSQYFANHYLAVADHYLIKQLRTTSFVRYMDDVVVWGNDKTDLLKLRDAYVSFVEKELLLVLNPVCVNETIRGVTFCGYRIFAKCKLLSKVSKRRFLTKNKEYALCLDRDDWSEENYQRHIIPLLAFVKKADSYGLRKRIYQGG